MFTLVLTSPTCSGGFGLRVQIPRMAAIARSPHSMTRTATAGCFRISRRDFPAESAARRRPSHPPMIWRARFGAQGRTRRTREAHRAARRKLARLVCRVHGGGGKRGEAAAVVTANDRSGDEWSGRSLPSLGLDKRTQFESRSEEL